MANITYAPRRAGDAFRDGLDAGRDRREHEQYLQRERLRSAAASIWARLRMEPLPPPSVVVGQVGPGERAHYNSGTDTVVISPDHTDDETLAHELAHAAQLKRDGLSAYAADDARRGHGPGFERAHREARLAAGLPVGQRMTAAPGAAPAARRGTTELGSRPWGPDHPNWRHHGYADCHNRVEHCERHNRPPADAGERMALLYGVTTRTMPGTVTLR